MSKIVISFTGIDENDNPVNVLSDNSIAFGKLLGKQLMITVTKEMALIVIMPDDQLNHQLNHQLKNQLKNQMIVLMPNASVKICKLKQKKS